MGVELQLQLQALERALTRLGVRFLEEDLPEEARVDGGLCTVDGNPVLYISPGAPPWRRAEVLVDALRRLPHEDLWLPPEIRKMLLGEDFAVRPVSLVSSGAPMQTEADPQEADTNPKRST